LCGQQIGAASRSAREWVSAPGGTGCRLHLSEKGSLIARKQCVVSPLPIGCESALRGAGDFVGAVTGDNPFVWVGAAHQFLKPCRPVINLVVGGANEGVAEGVKRRDDLFVGFQIIGGANFQPCLLQSENSFREAGHIVVRNPQNDMIGADGLLQ
jgi:hypothetical protein